MTDNEIIKALECCTNETGSCEKCPFDKGKMCLDVDIDKLALDIINRQKAEIERYNKGIDKLYEDFKSFYDTFPERLQEIKIDAIKKFAERLKEKSIFLEDEERYFGYAVKVEDIDDTLKELTKVQETTKQ